MSATEYYISTAKLAKKQANKSAKSNKTLKNGYDRVSTGVSESSKKAVKRIKKHHHIAIQLSILILVGSLLLLNNRTNQDTGTTKAFTSGLSTAPATVDEISSADVAATIARGANLVIADNVSNLADTLNAQVEFAATESYVDKPQIVETDASSSSDIITYTVKAGDTVSSVAKQFNITSDTIRWANSISGEALGVGKKLKILPVSGILHTVLAGETTAQIANKYGANKEQIIAFNDLEISGLKKGQRLVIPNGKKPSVTPTYFSSSSYSGFAFGTEPLYGGNGYSYGYCTWYAANRRAAIGKPIPRNLGNAVTWYSIAQSAGLGTGTQPRAGAVLWHANTYIAGGYGHVGFVEKVNADGSILVSDMNYPVWNGVTNRTIKPSEFGQYRFIY